MSDQVPFLPLSRINDEFISKFLTALPSILEEESYILGRSVVEFERRYAEYLGVRRAVGVGTGLDALKLALLALGIGPGDEVIAPSNTFIATILAISSVGATPILVEPDECTFNLSRVGVSGRLSDKTKAVIAVHLYGRMSDVDGIKLLCEEQGIALVEDAAQSHGAVLGGRYAGAWGDVAAFSFYPGKNLGAIGDGGAITTNDDYLAENIVSLRNYGSREKYIHEQASGMNSRLDTIQAAFLLFKLKALDSHNEYRRMIARQYVDNITSPYVQLPEFPTEEMSHVWHLFVIRTERRDELQRYLGERGISTLIHYPVPLHRQLAYEGVFSDEMLLTERLHQEILSLPIYPGMSSDQVNYTIEVLSSWEPE